MSNQPRYWPPHVDRLDLERAQRSSVYRSSPVARAAIEEVRELRQLECLEAKVERRRLEEKSFQAQLQERERVLREVRDRAQGHRSRCKRNRRRLRAVSDVLERVHAMTSSGEVREVIEEALRVHCYRAWKNIQREAPQ